MSLTVIFHRPAVRILFLPSSSNFASSMTQPRDSVAGSWKHSSSIGACCCRGSSHEEPFKVAPCYVGARFDRGQILQDSRADQWENRRNGIVQEGYLGSNAPLVAREEQLCAASFYYEHLLVPSSFEHVES